MESKELIQAISSMMKCMETLSKDLHKLINDDHEKRNVNVPKRLTKYETVVPTHVPKPQTFVDPAIHDIQMNLALYNPELSEFTFPPTIFRSKHFKIKRDAYECNELAMILRVSFMMFADRNQFKSKDDYTLFAPIMFDILKAFQTNSNINEVYDVEHIHDYTLIAKAIDLHTDVRAFVSYVIDTYKRFNSNKPQRLDHYINIWNGHDIIYDPFWEQVKTRYLIKLI